METHDVLTLTAVAHHEERVQLVGVDLTGPYVDLGCDLSSGRERWRCMVDCRRRERHGCQPEPPRQLGRPLRPMPAPASAITTPKSWNQPDSIAFSDLALPSPRLSRVRPAIGQ